MCEDTNPGWDDDGFLVCDACGYNEGDKVSAQKITNAIEAKTQVFNLEKRIDEINCELAKKLKALTNDEFFEYGKQLGGILIERGQLMEGSKREFFARIFFKNGRGKHYGS